MRPVRSDGQVAPEKPATVKRRLTLGAAIGLRHDPIPAADPLLTIWRQGGHWRPVPQASRSMRVGCDRVGVVSLLHIAAAQYSPLPRAAALATSAPLSAPRCEPTVRTDLRLYLAALTLPHGGIEEAGTSAQPTVRSS